jgi:hypothetical protein
VISSTFESRLVARDQHRDRPLERTAVSAPLAWLDAKSFYAWNRGTHHLERRTLTDGLPVVDPATISDDPANATRAGDIVVVALRGDPARRIEAVHLGDDKPRWTAGPGVLTFVRCAGDIAEPCIAGHPDGAGMVELRRIDPKTGILGEVLVPGADIEDAAVDAAGTHLAWVVDTQQIHVRALDGSEPDTVVTRLSAVRSLAFDPRGGILAAHAVNSGREIWRIAGDTIEPVATAGVAIVSLVRANPTGDTISYRTRTLTFELGELHLP